MAIPQKLTVPPTRLEVALRLSLIAMEMRKALSSLYGDYPDVADKLLEARALVREAVAMVQERAGEAA